MKLRCPDGILIRRAAEGDDEQIAELLAMASGDMLSFILKGLDPTADALRIYREMISEVSGIFSLQNCLVAECDRHLLGVANAFPARMIESQLEDVRMTEREEFLRMRIELNDPRSYLLNNIAVAPEHRRLGIGSLLLKAVIAEARLKAFSCVTLHVWADNLNATAFYCKFNFLIERHVVTPWHRDLRHVGGSLFLRLRLPARDDVGQGQTNYCKQGIDDRLYATVAKGRRKSVKREYKLDCGEAARDEHSLRGYRRRPWRPNDRREA